MKRSSKTEEWRKRLQDQKLSGIGPCKWCKQNNISYTTFQYWRRELRPLARSSFSEIADRPILKQAHIRIKCGPINVHLEADAEQTVLAKIFGALREASC